MGTWMRDGLAFLWIVIVCWFWASISQAIWGFFLGFVSMGLIIVLSYALPADLVTFMIEGTINFLLLCVFWGTFFPLFLRKINERFFPKSHWIVGMLTEEKSEDKKELEDHC